MASLGKLTSQQLQRFLRTPIPMVSRVVEASNTTSPYAPPREEFLTPWMDKLPSHLHLSPQLPRALCDSLFSFLSTQEEIPSPEDESMYQRYFDNCARRLQNLTIGGETDVTAYYPTIDYLIGETCKMFGFEIGYGTGPKVFHLLPGHAYRLLPSNDELTVFEHKNPTCAAAHLPGMVKLARNNSRFHLDMASSGAQSIIDKLALSLATKNLEFGAIHCLTQYQIMRLVTRPGFRPIALLSEPISINDDQTPILPVITSLLLRRKLTLPVLPDPDIPENLWEQIRERDDDESSPPDPSGAGMSGRSRGRGSGRGGGGGRGRGRGKRGGQIAPADCQGYDPIQHGIGYWVGTQKDMVSGAKLAKLLESVAIIPYFFDMKEKIYANNLAYAERIPSSNLWVHTRNSLITFPSRSSLSFSPHSSIDDCIVNIPPSQVNQTPPPSPPAEEIALRITEEVAHGENSWVVKGAFGSSTLPSSPPIIVKKFDTWEDCEHELSIYKRLAPLAGEDIPGVYGAYKVTGKQGDFGMLWLEDVGDKAVDENTSAEARRMVYSVALKIHQLGVEHGDLHQQNMVVANGPAGPQVKILDFHYASIHKCPGEGSCSELQNLKNRLNL